jgi:glutaredoxin 3
MGQRRAIIGDKVIIYGTATCPFCDYAREAYGDRAVFINIDGASDKLEEMLNFSGGKRIVPVIVDGGEVTVGFL